MYHFNVTDARSIDFGDDIHERLVIFSVNEANLLPVSENVPFPPGDYLLVAYSNFDQLTMSCNAADPMILDCGVKNSAQLLPRGKSYFEFGLLGNLSDPKSSSLSCFASPPPRSFLERVQLVLPNPGTIHEIDACQSEVPVWFVDQASIIDDCRILTTHVSHHHLIQYMSILSHSYSPNI